MKTPSFKSLASLLLAGALSVPLTGCAPEGAADDDTTEQSGALMRVATSVNFEAAAVEATAPVRKIPGTVTATLTTAPPPRPAPTSIATIRGASSSPAPVA